MARAALNEGVIRAKPPASGVRETHDRLTPGLVLRVSSTGWRSWIVRGRIRGRNEHPVTVTLGRADLYSLQEAREWAKGVLRQMSEGKDPRQDKLALVAAAQVAENMRFANVVQQWYDHHLGKLRSFEESKRYVERFLLPAWGERSIDTIHADDIADVIRGLRSTPGVARRVLDLSKGVFKYAGSMARLKAERLQADPAASIKASDFGIAAGGGERDVVLSNEHLRLAWLCAAELGTPWTEFFHLLILTGCRRREIADLKWDECDWSERLIVLPATRYKTKVQHVVPMSPQVESILSDLRGRYGNGRYALGRMLPGSTIDDMKDRLDKLIVAQWPAMPEWIPHDLRRTCRTGLSALGVDERIAELALGHTKRGIVRTYDRHAFLSEKRAALTAWADRVAAIVQGELGK